MTAYFTRARHAELGDAVLPVAAMESYPEWEAVGEPADNPDVLHAAIEHEQIAAALAAESEAPAQAAPKAAPKPPQADAPASDPDPAPSGADPKE